MHSGLRYIIFFLLITTAACNNHMVCPAYQSYFILDVDEQHKKFSPFKEDSTPKDKTWIVARGKYGIANELPYLKKEKAMETVSMYSIYKKKEDPFANLPPVELAEVDTVMEIDSAKVIASQYIEDRDNIEQMIYLHHYGKYFPREQQSEDDALKEDMKDKEGLVDMDEDKEEKPKRWWWPFGKKDKQEEVIDEEEEIDPDEGFYFDNMLKKTQPADSIQ